MDASERPARPKPDVERDWIDLDAPNMKAIAAA
jgi:hypothetical protein